MLAGCCIGVYRWVAVHSAAHVMSAEACQSGFQVAGTNATLHCVVPREGWDLWLHRGLECHSNTDLEHVKNNLHTIDTRIKLKKPSPDYLLVIFNLSNACMMDSVHHEYPQGPKWHIEYVKILRDLNLVKLHGHRKQETTLISTWIS